MTTEQLLELTRLTKVARVTVADLTAVANGAPTAAAVLQDLAELREAIEELVYRIQDRRARVWLNAHPLPNPPATPRLPLSTAVPHGVHIRRHTISGTPKAEQLACPPATSGRWQIGRLGIPKRRRSELSASPASSEDR